EQQSGVSGGDLRDALRCIRAPMYMLDRDGRVTWTNDAAREFVPTAVGRKASELLTPDQGHEANRQLAVKILGQAEHERLVDREQALRRHEGGLIQRLAGSGAV